MSRHPSIDLVINNNINKELLLQLNNIIYSYNKGKKNILSHISHIYFNSPPLK
jgi:hypothetical protein